MDIFTAINTRASALKLGAPGPTAEHLERILRAGTRAPDHGRLRPWRFIVLEGDARRVLSNAMITAFRRKAPQATEEQLEAEGNKALRSPTIIVVAAHITAGKIPEIEQVAAVSAAVENMFLYAHALGYGAMWKTGAAAYAPEVKAALGLVETDQIVAFLNLGAVASAGPVIEGELQGVVTRL